MGFWSCEEYGVPFLLRL